MDKDELISKAMSELGKKSAAAKKKKLGKDYWKQIRLKGAEARRKKKEEGEKKGTAKKKIITVKKNSLNMEYEP